MALPFAEYATSPMPDEDEIWYHRYDIYRSLGPERTVEGAFRLSQKEGGRVSEAKSSAWQTAWKKWSWRERAIAYDQQAIDRRIAAETELQEKKLAEFRELVEKIKDKAFSALENADYEAKDVKVGSITRLLEVLLPEYRNAYNIAEATKRNEVTGRDGEGLEINVSYVERNPNE